MARALCVGSTCFILLFSHVATEEPACGEESLGAIGVVNQVHGDLVYISGLNGSAPVLSRLGVLQGGRFNGVKLEVIKELGDRLVARVVETKESTLAPSQKVARLNGEMAPPERMRALREVHATRVSTGPVLNGRLDDAVWQQARPIEGFIQRWPKYFVPATERTVARIVYDQQKIYFGVECYDSAPNSIVANNMKRDSELAVDDNVQIILDPYDARQNGVAFFINSLGARQDMLLSQEGRTRNQDWDCIWEAKTRRHQQGWTAEIAIPFDQLRFVEGEDLTWGINLSRFIASKNESTTLMVGKRSSAVLSRYYMSDLAALKGLTAIDRKNLLQIKPYILPGTLRNLEAVDRTYQPDVEAGVDLRYGVTQNLTLDLSYNTDFAQVEGDQEQVNLTQFPLFFPEKRDFFLESASLFDFGEAASMRGGDTRPPTLLFYSRRIGLENGQPVPILLGSKLVGKTGGTGIGAMHIMMDSNGLSNKSDFSILRVKQDVFTRSNLGFMFVNKQTGSAYNRAGGLDFSFSPTPNFNVSAFYARTWDAGNTDEDDAAFIEAGYSGTIYSARFSYMKIENNFNPAVGFVNRRRGLRGLNRYYSELGYRPRPGVLGIRSIYFRPYFRVFTNANNEVKFWIASLYSLTGFSSGDWYIFDITRTYDVVEGPFRPSRRMTTNIPVGKYEFTTFKMRLFGSRIRKLSPRVSLEVGNYYTGRRYRVWVTNLFRPVGRLSLETDYEINWLRLPQANLNIHVLSNRLQYSFTTDFYVKVFAQWNNDSEVFSTNFLLNYRFRPGSDLYLVYDQGYGTEGGLHERNRALLLKLSYLIGL